MCQVLINSIEVDRYAAGGFFGEVALTAETPRCADVVSLGATRAVRCDPQGSPMGRRRPDPTELFRLMRTDFDEVVERFPALGDRLHEVGMARVRRTCSPQCSPLLSLRRRSSVVGAGNGGRRSSLLAMAAAAAAAAACESGSTPRRGSLLPGGAEWAGPAANGPPCSGPGAGSPAVPQRRMCGDGFSRSEDGDVSTDSNKDDELENWRGPTERHNVIDEEDPDSDLVQICRSLVCASDSERSMSCAESEGAVVLASEGSELKPGTAAQET